MPEEEPNRPEIRGNVNVNHGDFVAGDKTVVHGDPADSSQRATLVSRGGRKAVTRDLQGNIDAEGGDVVLGDKIIQFIQDRLNIYLFKDLWQLAFFLGVVIAAGAGIAGAAWYLRQPRRMTGNFNIAVAQFGQIQQDGSVRPSAQAQEISSTLFNFLDSEYGASSLGVTVQVEHHNMPLIAEDAQAQVLANRVNADIVIYGTVVLQADRAEFSPRFYVADRPDTSELTGQNELALPIDFSTMSLDTQEQVNAELRQRTEILFDFTKALIYSAQNDLDAGLRSVEAAIAAAKRAPAPFRGEEVLYLLAARIHINQRDYGDANQELDQALALNPQYARAYLARGNILYVQALADNFNVDLLNQALDAYNAAYAMPDQPEGAYIPVKAHTALGNVLVVRAQQTNDPQLYAQAIDNYTYVTSLYTKTSDPFLRSYAAIAWFGLGAAYERQGERQQALQAYQQTVQLADDPQLKQRAQRQIESTPTP